MRVDVRKADDVLLVDLDGSLVAGVGDDLLRDVMNELVAEGWTKIVLNLSKVVRIDSAGIGELVGGIRLAGRFGTAVRLVHVEGQVRNVLEMSRVLPLLEVHTTEAEALAHFGVSGPPIAAPEAMPAAARN
ncbi:MAG: STAS domain-containing protein [Acidobacteriota bacterium]